MPVPPIGSSETNSSYLSRIGFATTLSESESNAVLLLKGPDMFGRNNEITQVVKNNKPPGAKFLDEGGSNCRIDFNSFSGSDVNVYLLVDLNDVRKEAGEDPKEKNFCPLVEIQTLSISSARSVHPVRRLGESHVTEYTRGARTIAGSMVFATGTRDVFARLNMVSRREKASKEPFFTDELAGFHVLIACVNEYGQTAHAALTDVTLTNFGTTFSSDDMYLESTYTWVARYYHPLLPDPQILNRKDFPEAPSGPKLSQEYANSNLQSERWTNKNYSKRDLKNVMDTLEFAAMNTAQYINILNWMTIHEATK